MNRFSRQPVPKHTAAVVLVASATALVVALFVQFVLGWRPCVLCQLERIPYLIALVCCLGALATPFLPLPFRRRLLGLAGLVLAVNAMIAFYHVGVEQQWWQSALCPGGDSGALPDDLAEAMSQPVEVRCDEPAWSFHGVTMAWVNIAYSGLLSLGLQFKLRRRR